MSMIITAEILGLIKRASWHYYLKNAAAIYPYDADDISQEICCKIVEKYDGARDLKRFVWFYAPRIVVDLARTLHSRYLRMYRSDQEIGDHGIAAVDDTERINLRLSLDALTRTAPRRDAEIVNRCLILGETQAEIARDYGLGESRVNQIIHDTLRRRSSYEENILGIGNHPNPGSPRPLLGRSPDL